MAIVRRAAELPLDRITRKLTEMQANALADQISAHVSEEKDLEDARTKKDQLSDKLTKTSGLLFRLERELDELRKYTPSLWERVTGTHAAALAECTKKHDQAKMVDDAVRAEYRPCKAMVDSLTTAHKTKIKEKAPIAEMADRNLKIVAHARTLLAEAPRAARFGPWAFIAAAAHIAGFRRPPDKVEKLQQDKLPTGDLRYRRSIWGIPFD